MLLKDSGSGAVLNQIPDFFLGIGETLTSDQVTQASTINSALKTAAMVGAGSGIERPALSLSVPFQQILDASRGDASSDLRLDTSGVAGDITEFMSACAIAGYKVEPAAAQTTSARGAFLGTIGEPTTYTVEGKDVATITVTGIEVDPACDGDYPQEPANGHFVVVNLEVKVEPSAADPVWLDTTSWVAYSPEGQKANDVYGNSFGCLADSREVPSQAGPGEAVVGSVILDVPNEHGSVGFTNLGTSPLAEWTY